MEACSILHHGAVRGVTGSCHELRLGEDYGVLVDCGLFQGAETSGQGADAGDLTIDFPIQHIKALVVTHVHIDHVGRIPYLLAAGFKGPILCSQPSAQLLPLVLEDAVKVGFTRNKAMVDQFLGVLKKRLVALPYQQWFTLLDAGGRLLRVRLQRAGHILGSAYVEFDAGHRPEQGEGLLAASAAGEKQGEGLLDPLAAQRVEQGGGLLDALAGAEPDKGKGKSKKPVPLIMKRVVFSGDLGAPHAPLLPPPKPPRRCDTLVIESTYGNRVHPNRRQRRAVLQQVIERAVENSGVVLVPAFSIGRTQELIYELEAIIAEGGERWARMAIVVDSPLANRFTKVYKQLKPFWDDEARALLQRGRDPLDFDQLLTVGSHQEHLRMLRRLQQTHEPCVVIAASGMCAGGRMVNYLKALIGDERTDVLFVGYQAAGTPGRVIASGAKQVRLDGEDYAVRAAVYQVGGYSAHADQADLLRFATRMNSPPGEIRLIHGDEDAKAELKTRLEALLPEAHIHIPKG